jgi:hypothetical protein
MKTISKIILEEAFSHYLEPILRVKIEKLLNFFLKLVISANKKQEFYTNSKCKHVLVTMCLKKY